MTPKREEQIVIDNLIHQGFTNIRFEPDGNVPPDILVDNKIAIEVRRLNQNKKTPQGFEGLEQDENKIQGILKKVMNKVSDDDYGKSAFVGFSFSRPQPSDKQIRDFASKVRVEHKLCMDQQKEYRLDDSFRIILIPSILRLDGQYVFGFSIDEDSGGSVLNLVYENLKMILAEKETKLSKYKQNYSEWWLAVVDNIGFGLSQSEIVQFNDLPKIEHRFDKVLLVSAINHKFFCYLNV